MKRCALYMRVSTIDQHPETQLHDLHQLVQQRGYQIVHEYTDRISGTKAKRPALDQLMSDARRAQFDIVLVWASDRLARSTRYFLEVLDELNRLKIEYVSFRENLDTGGPLGRAMVIIIGRRPLDVDRPAVLRDRARGMSLTQISKAHTISRALVSKILREEKRRPQLTVIEDRYDERLGT